MTIISREGLPEGYEAMPEQVYIRDIGNRAYLILATNSQDTQPIKDLFKVDYDGYLVSVIDGDYAEVWGFYGIIPVLSKEVYRIK